MDTVAERPGKIMGRPKKKPNVEPDKAFGIAIRGSLEWREWVVSLANFRRLKTTDLIDQALVEYANSHGFPEKAPKR